MGLIRFPGGIRDKRGFNEVGEKKVLRKDRLVYFKVLTFKDDYCYLVSQTK